jgi:hypothetical protein
MNSNTALLIDLNIYYVQCLVKDLLRPLQRVTFQDIYSLWSDTFPHILFAQHYLEWHTSFIKRDTKKWVGLEWSSKTCLHCS